MLRININSRIKLLRNEILKNDKGKKLSIRQFAEELGVTKGVINNIECEIVETKDYMIKLICQTFNVREEWLRDGIEPIFNGDKEDDILKQLENQGVSTVVLALIEAYLELDNEGKKTFNEYAKSVIAKYNKNSSNNNENLDDKTVSKEFAITLNNCSGNIDNIRQYY